jgi:hypothetical protein
MVESQIFRSDGSKHKTSLQVTEPVLQEKMVENKCAIGSIQHRLNWGLSASTVSSTE